jgi:hypothetical protein
MKRTKTFLEFSRERGILWYAAQEREVIPPPLEAARIVEQLVAKARVEALDVAVLPRTAPLDVSGLGCL